MLNSVELSWGLYVPRFAYATNRILVFKWHHFSFGLCYPDIQYQIIQRGVILCPGSTAFFVWGPHPLWEGEQCFLDTIFSLFKVIFLFYPNIYLIRHIFVKNVEQIFSPNFLYSYRLFSSAFSFRLYQIYLQLLAHYFIWSPGGVSQKRGTVCLDWYQIARW